MKLPLRHDSTRYLRLAIALADACIAASACTWVKVSPAGARVAVRTADQVANCKYIGVASGTTIANALGRRDPRKLEEEVTALAKNEAAKIGGNVIVAKSALLAGTQDFTVYLCE